MNNLFKNLQLLKQTINEKSTQIKDEQYEPPMSLNDIRRNYGDELYNTLKNDVVHSWRANTGIELIHKEPSYEELVRIMKNWELMPKNLKIKSDKKSIELFGMTNKQHYNKLIKTYNKGDLKNEK